MSEETATAPNGIKKATLSAEEARKQKNRDHAKKYAAKMKREAARAGMTISAYTEKKRAENRALAKPVGRPPKKRRAAAKPAAAAPRPAAAPTTAPRTGQTMRDVGRVLYGQVDFDTFIAVLESIGR